MEDTQNNLVLPLESLHQPWHIVFLNENKKENDKDKEIKNKETIKKN